MLARYSSTIRTGCANERPSGSVRGAPGNRCPYRDLADRGFERYGLIATTELLQLRVLRLGLLQDRDIRVGILPECEEIFVSGERPDAGSICIRALGSP
jgi:hypothetical protein